MGIAERRVRMDGIYSFIARHSPIDKDTMVRKIISDLGVTRFTAEDYILTLVLQKRIENAFGVLEAKNERSI
jgi:hypothetical protein